jgi:hypothetical protein
MVARHGNNVPIRYRVFVIPGGDAVDRIIPFGHLIQVWILRFESIITVIAYPVTVRISPVLRVIESHRPDPCIWIERLRYEALIPG